jgi:5-(carboxyamino)imidazole ribonucleotide mutase
LGRHGVPAASRIRPRGARNAAPATSATGCQPLICLGFLTMPSKPGKKPAAVVPPIVAVIMGSKSDWETMSAASEILRDFGVSHECRIVSAHRTPELMTEFASGAEGRGIEVIIAGAGGAAHLPGMTAAHTTLPVLGVPIESKALKGMDSLLSIVQMPAGVPVATLAIGSAGAKNAALLAISILAGKRKPLREKLKAFRELQRRKVLEDSLL